MPDLSNKRSAAFLDRDGVLIEDRGYVHRPEDLALLPGVPSALSALKSAGYMLIVITNQSGVGRGMFSEQQVQTFHHHLQDVLKAAGSPTIDQFYLCPHHPEAKVAQYRKECDCRKPKPGLILKAIQDLGINPARSFMVGDKIRDIEAGREAGVRTAFVGTGNQIQINADFMAESLPALLLLPHFLEQ